MRITKQTTVMYYVEEEGTIYGGPFDTKEEASRCLRQYQYWKGIDVTKASLGHDLPSSPERA